MPQKWSAACVSVRMSASASPRRSRRPIQLLLRRHAATGGSLTLHVGLIALLLIPPHTPPQTTAPSASISVLTLGAPSPQQRAAAESAASQASVATPAATPAPKSRPVRRTKPAPARAAPAAPSGAATATLQASAQTTAPLSATSAAAAPDSSAAENSVAAAAPDAPPPKVPPPIEYLRRVSRIISLSQKYPWNARQYGHQGDAVIRMHLTREGAVMAATLIQSSGHESLDAEARDVILRIRRFPPFPADYIPQQREFDIDQPVSFRTYLN